MDEVCYTDVLAEHGWNCALSGKMAPWAPARCLSMRSRTGSPTPAAPVTTTTTT